MSFRRFSYCVLFSILFLVPAVVRGQGTGPETDEKRFDRSQPRTWTDVNGNKQEATFAGVLRDQILLKVGTSTIRIELKKFSREDIGWVAEVLRREGKINQLPAEYREYQPGPASEPTTTTTPPDPAPGGTPEPASSTPPGGSPAGVPETSVPTDSPAMNSKSEGTEAGAESVDVVSDYREWEDHVGQKIRAKFQSVIGDDVLLKPEKGSITRVALKNLSRKDLKLIRDYHEAKGMLERLPREFREEIDLNAPAVTRMTPGTRGPSAAEATPDEKLRVIRTWKDNDGKELVARFWSLSGDQITLQDEARRATYGLANLSHDDLEWLQDALREAGRLTELPLPYRDPQDRKKSELELIRFRRTGYVRKWTSFKGKTMVGQYDRFLDDGLVRIYDNNGSVVDFPYTDFSEEDQTYLRDRLKREVPGQFFPEKDEATAGLTPPEGSETTVWTDLEGRQLHAKFVRLDRNGTVAVLDAGAGEVPYIRAFLDEDAGKKIKGIIEHRNTLAKANAEAARARFQERTGSGGGSIFNPIGDRGMSSGYTDPSEFQDPTANLPDFPEIQPPQIPEIQIPKLVWTYKCNICGTEFGEESGLKQGDKCPVCSKKNTVSRFTIWGAIIGATVAVIGAMARRR